MRTRCLNVVRGDRFACRLVTNRPVIADLNTSRNLRLGGCLLLARFAMQLVYPSARPSHTPDVPAGHTSWGVRGEAEPPDTSKPLDVRETASAGKDSARIEAVIEKLSTEIELLTEMARDESLRRRSGCARWRMWAGFGRCPSPSQRTLRRRWRRSSSGCAASHRTSAWWTRSASARTGAVRRGDPLLLQAGPRTPAARGSGCGTGTPRSALGYPVRRGRPGQRRTACAAWTRVRGSSRAEVGPPRRRSMSRSARAAAVGRPLSR
jgi:hypothetical protein